MSASAACTVSATSSVQGAAALASTAGVAGPFAKRLRLPPRAAFLLEASITLGFLAGSSAPTPLYAIYRARWGFSSILLTVVFAVYAVAVLAALLVAGRLSDHVGRRPVLILATLAQAGTMLLFTQAGGVGDLLLARVVQGLSAGAALAAVGAGLMDIDKTRGATANAVAPMLGTAFGAVVSGAFVQWLPAPTQLIYLTLALVFVAQAIGLGFVEETAERRAGAWASLVPQFAVPAPSRGPLWRVAPAIVAVWALAGFYASLGPTLMHSMVASGTALMGGVALFVLAGSGALSVWVASRSYASTRAQSLQDPRQGVRIGMVALTAGLALVLLALRLQSIVLFLVATAIAGVGFGMGFQGALRSIVTGISGTQRAGVLSVIYVMAYLAMGAPAVLAGLDLALRGDLLGTARGFDLGVMLLAVVAWRVAPRSSER